MNNASTDAVGYLIVKVSTARGAIPLENATVSVKGSSIDSSGIIYSLETDSSGLTPRLPLPTPQKSLSQAPNLGVPFSLWNVDVYCKGFISAKFLNVPVYPEVTSVQNAELIPLTEGFSPSESYNESETPDL